MSEDIKAVCDKNVSKTDARFYTEYEKRIAHAREKIPYLFKDGLSDKAKILRVFEDSLPQRYRIDGNLPTYNELCRLSDCVYIADCADVAKRIRTFCKADFDIADKSGRKVVSYFKNPLSEKAYNVFKKDFFDLCASPSRDFVSACEDVYYGRVDYCILPLCNTYDGRLSGFYKLTEKYELFITADCTVSVDEDSDTRFALFSKSPVIPSDKDAVFKAEVKIPHSNDTLFTVSCASKCLGLQIIRLDGLPSENGGCDLFTLSGKLECLLDILFLFDLLQLDQTVFGIYL